MANQIYFVDGGVNELDSICKPQKNCDYFFIGDNDSSSGKQKTFPMNTFYLQKAKDYSDFAFVLDRIRFEKQDDLPMFIEVFSAFGKRKDHEYINFFEVTDFVNACSFPVLVFLYPKILLTNSKIEIENFKNKIFSMISLLDNGHCSIKGAQYSGSIHLKRPSQGLSNKSLSHKVSIEALKSTLAIFC
ncbi:MAG: hypothetical protein K2X39_07870 [Silvanigrellaceae bacterium]|nr:hypothetical protein [Silvanigrellaceae bacterium]